MRLLLALTMPLMPVMPAADDLDFITMEVLLLARGESEYELSTSALDDNDATNVIMLDDESPADEHGATMVKKGGAARPAAGMFADDDEADAAVEEDAGDEVVVAEDFLGEDDAVEEDIFGTGDEDFEEAPTTGESHADFVAPVPQQVYREADWGMATFAGLAISALLMAGTGMVLFDLVRTLWSGAEPTAPVGALLTTFRGMFG